MFNFGSNRNRSYGSRQQNLPIFSIALVACYFIITIIFFFTGMSEGPGRVYTPVDNSPNSGESAATPTPTPTPTPDQNGDSQNLPMRPAVKVKGLFYNLWYPEDNALRKCIDYIESTELNAIVIDIKCDNGRVMFQTDNELIPVGSQLTDSQISNIYGPTDYANLQEAVADLNARGIYAIARLVSFKDNIHARNSPESAIVNNRGEVWRDNNDVRWLNPHNRDNWDFLVAIASEAAKIGFDEIQLDYVRFPLEGRLGEINYGSASEEATRYQIISEFVAYMRDEMVKLGVRTSADIFGISAISDRDAGHIGQNVQLLLPSLHYLSPMIYPSHFANSSNGVLGNGVGQTINGILFTHPDTQPYEVIYNSLQHFTRHIDRFKEENPGVAVATVRPFLQYFTASYLREGYWITYGPEEIYEQISAVYDAGFDEWLLWSHDNSYHYSPFIFP